MASPTLSPAAMQTPVDQAIYAPPLSPAVIQAAVAQAIAARSGPKRGRPTRLTAEIQAAVVRGVRYGACFNAACRQADIAVGTGRDWLARGRGTHAAGRSATPLYAAFAAAIEEAQRPGADKAVDPIWEAWKELVGTIVETARSTDTRPRVIQTIAAEKFVGTEGAVVAVWNTRCKLVRAIVKIKRLDNGKLEVRGITAIIKDVQPNWRAALRLLEHRYPQDWSLTYRLRHSARASMDVVFYG